MTHSSGPYHTRGLLNLGPTGDSRTGLGKKPLERYRHLKKWSVDNWMHAFLYFPCLHARNKGDFFYSTFVSTKHGKNQWRMQALFVYNGKNAHLKLRKKPQV